MKQGECGGIHVALNLSIGSGPTTTFDIRTKYGKISLAAHWGIAMERIVIMYNNYTTIIIYYYHTELAIAYIVMYI